MKVKAGTVAIEMPKSGASKDRCFLCTAPSHDHGGEAFIAGMIEGVLAVLTTRPHLPSGRVPFCVEHETVFREHLAVMAQDYPEVLDKLGVPYMVLDKETEVR